jgi:hypothetical protein
MLRYLPLILLTCVKSLATALAKRAFQEGVGSSNQVPLF